MVSLPPSSLSVIPLSSLIVFWDVFILVTAWEQSCNDELTVYPQDTLVVERHWCKFRLDTTGLAECTFGTSHSKLVRAAIVMFESACATLDVQLNRHDPQFTPSILETLSRVNSLAVDISGKSGPNQGTHGGQEVVIDSGGTSTVDLGPHGDWKMPQLEKVPLSRTTMSELKVCLAQDVTQLYLSHAVYDDSHDVVHSFLEVLGRLPRLKSLRLAHAIPPLFSGYLLTKEPITLPCLTSLEVEDTPYLCTAVLRLISTPELAFLSLCFATHTSRPALLDFADVLKTGHFAPESTTMVHSVSLDSRRLRVWNQPAQLDSDPRDQAPAFLDVTFLHDGLADVIELADMLPLDRAKALRLTPNYFYELNDDDCHRLCGILPHIEHFVVGQFAFNDPPRSGSWDTPMGPAAKIFAFDCDSSTFPMLSTLTLVDFDSLQGRDAVDTLPTVLKARADNGQPIKRLIFRGGDLFFEDGMEAWAEDLLVGAIHWSGTAGPCS